MWRSSSVPITQKDLSSSRSGGSSNERSHGSGGAGVSPKIGRISAGRVRERLAAYYDEFGLGAVPEPSDPFPRLDEERLQMMLDLRPPVVSFHFGLPPADTMKRIKQSGAVVLSSATTVAEARKLEA